MNINKAGIKRNLKQINYNINANKSTTKQTIKIPSMIYRIDYKDSDDIKTMQTFLVCNISNNNLLNLLWDVKKAFFYYEINLNNGNAINNSTFCIPCIIESALHTDGKNSDYQLFITHFIGPRTQSFYSYCELQKIVGDVDLEPDIIPSFFITIEFFNKCVDDESFVSVEKICDTTLTITIEE